MKNLGPPAPHTPVLELPTSQVPGLPRQGMLVMTTAWSQGQTYLGNKILLISAGQDIGFSSAQLTLGEVGVHLISIKVSIVGFAVGIVET